MTASSGTQASICVDRGTTNTRVWIVKDKNIVDRMGERIGLRDAAHERNKWWNDMAYILFQGEPNQFAQMAGPRGRD